jgi:putative transposase
MSLTNFFVDDEGNSPMYDRNYRLFENKIQNLQRMLSSETKKYKKKQLRKRLTRVHEHIANKRHDFIEKLSYKLVHENDVIIIETLSLKDIAKFRTWEERKNSKDKSNHGKSVHNLGWGIFLNRLKTKAEENGKIILKADKWFASSKTCNHCGYINKELTVEDREWICPICNNSIQRDMNAAMNLKDLGLKFLAEGSSVNADESRNDNHL